MAKYLDKLYADRSVYHGELHDHAASGGTSDGKQSLATWITQLAEQKMDFAAILDHRQVRHMYLPEWQDGLFIAGTEPGTEISDSRAKVKGMHYNMLFPHRDELVKLLAEFPEYEFTGGIEGHFIYPQFTRERFGQLIDAVKAHGGFFVHPHPKQVMQSDDPLDYWFRDETGIEVFYNDFDSEYTDANYPLWTALLAKGKRVFACAGGDKHNNAGTGALTTIYLAEKTSRGFMDQLRHGDFVCGAVGIRMCIGDARMGGKCDFTGKQLEVCISDFHEAFADRSHKYRADVITDKGTVCSFCVDCAAATEFSMDAQNCKFYRIEIVDETIEARIAIGNPIWNM
ncbi:MAG: hypothetical protein IJC56_03435 [Clostridia bacterium]|nr:hypothetical protein [Clostridia bacterium]